MVDQLGYLVGNMGVGGEKVDFPGLPYGWC